MYLAHVQAVGVGVRGDVLPPGTFAHVEPHAGRQEHLQGTILTVLYGFDVLYVLHITVLYVFDRLICAIFGL